MQWRISSFPELQHLSETERAALLRKHVGATFIRLAISCIARGFLIAILAGLVVTIPKVGRNPPPFALWEIVLPLGAGIVFAAGLFQFSMIRIRGQLRIYLEEQRARGERIPVCLKCGYAVAEDQAHCPECGAGT